MHGTGHEPRSFGRALYLTRTAPFTRAEYRFVEAIGGFLSQTLEGFSSKEAIEQARVRRRAIKMQQRVLIQELQEERELRERFVSALSHDLRTPLTAARLLTQHLAAKQHDPATARSLSARIVSNIDRIDRMINNLLDVSRIRAGEGLPIAVEECHLDQIVLAAVDSLNRIYGPRFVVESGSADIIGYWDRSGIVRILENLATNAIKYGQVFKPVTIRFSSLGDRIEISVHNEGKAHLRERSETSFWSIQPDPVGHRRRPKRVGNWARTRPGARARSQRIGSS